MDKSDVAKKVVAVFSSFVTISNLITNVSAAVNISDQAKTLEIPKDSNIKITSIDRTGYQRKTKADNLGAPTIAQALEAILEDARGPCLGSVRCNIVTSETYMINAEDRFKQLELDKEKVGEFALSISGDARKARILAIIENKDYNYGYVRYLMNEFIANKSLEMERRGLTFEKSIAEKAIVKDIGRFTAIAMNPHATESMSIIEEGLNSLL